MEVFRFDTKISKEGVIKVPLRSGLFDMEAQVIILLKEKKDKKRMTARDFVNRWGGVLKKDQVEDTKFGYLSEKYK